MTPARYPTISFGEDELSPGEMEDQVKRAAGGLQRMGISEGDVVALMLHNEPALLVAMLAVRELGAYFCLLNWHFKASEASFILEDSAAKVLIVQGNLVAQISEGIPAALDRVHCICVQPAAATRAAFRLGNTPFAQDSGMRDWDTWLAQQTRRDGPPMPVRGAMVYTSGTTGKPKGVRRLAAPPGQAQAQAAASLNYLQSVFGVDASSRCLLSAPMYHSAPCSYAVHAAISGAWMRIEPRFDALQTLAGVQRFRISHLYLVPTMMHRLLRLPAQDKARHDLSGVRWVISTGAPCPAQAKREMIEWWGPVIHEAYASSETGYVTLSTSADAFSHPGSVGKALAGARIRIYRDGGEPAATGETGAIYVRQAATPDFTYNNAPESRAKMERDGLVTVGDVGYFDADGYLYICDRQSDMVISGGVNIYPAEIEAALATLPGVADSAVFGIPDADFGEALMAVVQPQPGVNLLADAVRIHLGDRLANYKVPRRIEFLAELPREDTGKIYKRKLRDPYWAGQARKI